MVNRLIIYEYIRRIKKEDIVKFCNLKGISVSVCEMDLIYGYIKNDYKRFFDNPTEVLEEIKNKVSDNTFKEIMFLYEKYKNVIK